MTVPSDRKEAQLEAFQRAFEYVPLARYDDVTKHAEKALMELLAVVERYENALRGYHDLAPALAECANECGEAVLYSQLHQANVTAEDVLSPGKEAE